MPEHLMKGKNGLFVRRWVYGIARIRAIYFFPEEAFTPVGAMVKTCLLVLQKVRPGEKVSEDDPAFLCEVENLGYEATGKPKAGSEIAEAAAAFHVQAGWK
jgi:type I restriction enzyme M protein